MVTAARLAHAGVEAPDDAATAHLGSAAAPAVTEDAMTPAPPPPAPPAPTTAPGRPPLRRDPDAGILAGVAAGLARHLDVDVVLVRIGFVVGTILTQGLGLLAYLLCWVFIPKATEEEVAAAPPPSARRDPAADGRGAAFWIGIGLLALGAVWFLGAATGPGVGFALFDAGVVVPLLLIGLGVALWRTGDRSDTTAAATVTASVPAPVPSSQETTMPTSTSVPPPAPATDRDDTVPIASDRDGGTPPPPSSAPPESGGQGGGFTPPPVPTRPRSLLTRLTLGVALLTVGILWILEVTTTLSLGPLAILAIGLAVVGAGLLVGSVVGRGRPLILVGVVLLPLVLAGTVFQSLPGSPLIEQGFRGSVMVGERIEQPATAAELESSYEQGAGSFELDLRGLTLDEDASVLIEMGAGEIVVRLPRDVNVVARGSLGAGELQLLDVRRSGLALDAEASATADVPDPDTAPTLELRVNAGFGDVSVRR